MVFITFGHTSYPRYASNNANGCDAKIIKIANTVADNRSNNWCDHRTETAHCIKQLCWKLISLCRVIGSH